MEMDLTGYTTEEIEHLQRVEQKQALHEELYWLADQLKGDAKEVALTAIQRVAFLNHQGDEMETRAVNWKAIAEGSTASAQEFQRQRDAVLDEWNEFLKSIEDGTNPIVKTLIAEAYQDAFEEYHLNGGRLVALVAKLQVPRE